MYDSFGLFINGAWTRGDTSADVFSPVTEKPLGAVSTASPEDTVRAIDAPFVGHVQGQCGLGENGILNFDADQ